MNIKKTLVASTTALFLAGCNIEINVPEGGRVVSESGAYTCETGEKSCVIAVSDLFFDENFIAEPDEGMTFTGWEKLDGGLCGGKVGPCRLFTSGFEGNDALMGLLDDAEKTFFLNATFAPDDGSGDGEPICETTDEKLGNMTWDQLCRTGVDEASCGADHGGAYSLGSCETEDNPPTGYCEEDNGVRTYYYDHSVGHDLYEFGCQFVGEWHPLT